jgi:isoleucyl-tRNA synthetase
MTKYTSSTEQSIIQFWKDNTIFQKSVENNKDKPRFTIFEGPPTANGKPGIHHVLTRTYKDIIGRFQTMNGKYVPRIAGWDEHGLPVELEAQRTLNLDLSVKSRQAIVEYGVDKFNTTCQQLTSKCIADWEVLTERMGYWVDFQNAYRTSSNQYISRVWDLIGEINQNGLLKKDFKVVPWATDTESTVSNAEMAQGYKDVVDKAITVKFLTAKADQIILVWTTTPWTLPANMAIAFSPKLKYVRATREDDFEGNKVTRTYILAEFALTKDFTVVEELTSEYLQSLQYFNPFAQKYFALYPADFVHADAGTGLVHIAPAFGADDAELWRTVRPDNSPVICHVEPDGSFNDQAPEFLRGQNLLNLEKTNLSFKKANAQIKKYLKAGGFLFDEQDYTHSYPHNWRTGNPLIYLRRPCWYISTESLADKLVEENQKITWYPEHIKEGRFGNWLANSVDWCISRERFWGTPLPIFEKEDGSFEVKKPQGHHKPEVDSDGRVPEVLDCWFDSGAMPHAAFDEYHQADVICEAIDQTRGWFYSLLAIGVATKRGTPFKSALCLGHILDKDGIKMSKSKGNIVDPLAIFEKYSSDAVRFYMASHVVGNSISFDEKQVAQVHHGLINQIWNVFQYYETYKFENVGLVKLANPFDRWILAESQNAVNVCKSFYENYEFHKVAEKIKELSNLISTVWIRGCRERFVNREAAVVKTLSIILKMLCQISAPMLPMLSEAIWQKLSPNETSIHLQCWKAYPALTQDQIDMMAEMKQVADYIQQLRDMRIKAKINLRQPVQSISIPIKLKFFEEFLLIELNAKELLQGEVGFDTNLSSDLMDEGKFREIVRAFQIVRKDSGLQAREYIRLKIDSDNELMPVFNKYVNDIQDKISCKLEFSDLVNSREVMIVDRKIKYNLSLL